MTLQNKCRHLFASHKHQHASVGILAKPYAVLVLLLLLFGTVGRLDAATVGVIDVFVDPNSNELFGFFTGLEAYTQSDLIHPTLTAFSGDSSRNIIVAAGGSVPAPGTRSLLLTHDFNLYTGIINPAIGATAATLQFSPPLINGPGPDLVMFETSFSSGEDFQMQVNGNTMAYIGANYGTELTQYFDYLAFTRDAGTPNNISQLENDSYSFEFLFTIENIFGIAIDLDDFGVDPLGIVSTVHFGSIGVPGANDSFDPVLFMGIRSAVIPEPSAIILAALGLLGVGWRRRQRV